MRNFSKFGCKLSTAGIWMLIFAFSVFSFGCSGTSAESKNKDQANNQEQVQPSIAVSTAKTVSREVPSYVQVTGSLVAYESSNIAPKVAGQVIATPVNVGAFVRQGDILVRLDDKEARLRVQELQANVRTAQAAVRQAEARLGLTGSGNFQASTIPEVRFANSNYQQALAQLRQAQANEQRYRELVQTGDTSMQNYETYRTQRDTVQAQVNSAEQQLQAAINTAKQSNQAVQSAQASVQAVQAQVATAQQSVADNVIRAPFPGYISARPAALGEYVTPATTIVTLLKTNPLKVNLQVAEKDVPSINVGMSVSLQVDAYKNRKFAGTVTAINPSVDASSRAAIVEATVENGNNALRAGMFATAQIARPGGNNAVFVPRNSVLADPNTQSYRVFVIQNDVARLRVVQLGQEEGDTMQILSGVNNDEIVATSNLPQLFEGAKVRVQ